MAFVHFELVGYLKKKTKSQQSATALCIMKLINIDRLLPVGWHNLSADTIVCQVVATILNASIELFIIFLAIFRDAITCVEHLLCVSVYKLKCE